MSEESEGEYGIGKEVLKNGRRCKIVDLQLSPNPNGGMPLVAYLVEYEDGTTESEVFLEELQLE